MQLPESIQQKRGIAMVQASSVRVVETMPRGKEVETVNFGLHTKNETVEQLLKNENSHEQEIT